MADTFHNITEGSIPRQVVRLAWPAVLAMLLRTALTITDAFWVGHVGKAEMAAVISSMFVLWTFFSIFDIVWIGSVAVIARFYGARNFDLVGHSARQAIVLGSAAAVVMMIVGYITVRWLFHVMETAAAVTDMGTMYLRIVFGVTIPLVMGELFSAMFRASGDTRTPLMISATATGINIILDPLLIFGVGPFPKLGVAGAALATAIAYSLAFALYLLAIKRGKLTFKFSWPRYSGPDLRMMWQMIKIGSPLATAGVVFSVAYLFMNKIVSGSALRRTPRSASAIAASRSRIWSASASRSRSRPWWVRISAPRNRIAPPSRSGTRCSIPGSSPRSFQLRS